MIAAAPSLHLLELPPQRRKIVVFRGDLLSSLGFGYYTRALAELVSAEYEVLGVDLHPNPGDNVGRFPGRLVADDELSIIARESASSLCVISLATPEQYVYFPGAVNVGIFPWETDAVSYQLDWPELIMAMDANWSVTSFQQTLLRRHGWTKPSPIIPWPFDFSAGNTGDKTVAAPPLRRLQALPTSTGDEPPPVAIKDLPGPIFLTVSSLAPRKGLPILLSEWRDYLEGGGVGVLALKLRPVHHGDAGDGGFGFLHELMVNAGFYPGSITSIAYTFEDLGYDEVQALYTAADAYVTATYGEGFGGPVLEALLAATPVIAPRHTSLADLLPSDYPLQVAAHSLHVGLTGNSPIYPAASSWWIPERGALRDRMSELAALPHERRREIAAAARRHAQGFCSREAVAASLADVLRSHLD